MYVDELINIFFKVYLGGRRVCVGVWECGTRDASVCVSECADLYPVLHSAWILHSHILYPIHDTSQHCQI